MGFLPVFLALSSQPVVLVGSGSQALAKLHLLRAAGAQVRWFSTSDSDDERLPLATHYAGDIRVALGEPGDSDIETALAVVSAAGNEIDTRIAARARRLNVPVNVVDQLDLSTFIFPAIVNRGDVVVAIGTAGASPVLARRLRERIEAILPARVGELAALMKRHRDKIVAVRRRWPGFSARRFWERMIDGPVGAAALAGRSLDAEAALLREIEHARIPEKTAGAVHLVSAGPGDADLLTLRALQVLQNADVVFYDELVTPEILDRSRRDAELVFVGKRRGEPGVAREEINRRLTAAAHAGLQVVRLSGGDRFEADGEDTERLRQAGVATVVIPGVATAQHMAAGRGIEMAA